MDGIDIARSPCPRSASEAISSRRTHPTKQPPSKRSERADLDQPAPEAEHVLRADPYSKGGVSPGTRSG